MLFFQRAFVLLPAVLNLLAIDAASLPLATSCDAYDKELGKSIMAWTDAPVSSDTYSISASSKTYVPNSYITVSVRVNKPNQQYVGLMLYAVNSKGTKVGVWKLPRENPERFIKPPNCDNRVVMHANALQKNYLETFKFFMRRDQGDITFRCLIKWGNANQGAFFWPKEKVTIKPTKSSTPIIWHEAGDMTCPEKCQSVGGTCNAGMLGTITSPATMNQVANEGQVLCFGPPLAYCGRGVPMIGRHDYCYYRDSSCSGAAPNCNASPELPMFSRICACSGGKAALKLDQEAFVVPDSFNPRVAGFKGVAQGCQGNVKTITVIKQTTPDACANACDDNTCCVSFQFHKDHTCRLHARDCRPSTRECEGTEDACVFTREVSTHTPSAELHTNDPTLPKSKTCEELGWDTAVRDSNICGGSQIQGQCSGKVSYEEAALFCQQGGARLCSVSEIGKGAGIHSGCELDDEHVWTASACGDFAHEITAGWAKHISTKGTQCEYNDTLHHARCCADHDSVGLEEPQNSEQCLILDDSKAFPTSAASPSPSKRSPIFFITAGLLSSLSWRSAPLALLALLVTPAQAHNWVNSNSRASFASLVTPCVPYMGEPHTKVGVGQEFQLEFSTGHPNGLTYWALLKLEDSNRLDKTSENVIKDYIDNVPRAKRDQYLDTHWDRVHVVAPDRPKKELALYGKELRKNDAQYIVREEAFHLYGKRPKRDPIDSFRQYTYKARDIEADKRVEYKSAKYPWIIAAAEYKIHHNSPSEADLINWVIPKSYGPGDYVLKYQFKGYHDCVDIKVVSGGDVKQRYGDPEAAYDCPEEHLLYFGSGRKLENNVPNENACQKLCQQNNKCNYWSYFFPDTPEGVKKQCQMFAKIRREKFSNPMKTHVISGPKICGGKPKATKWLKSDHCQYIDDSRAKFKIQTQCRLATGNGLQQCKNDCDAKEKVCSGVNVVPLVNPPEAAFPNHINIPFGSELCNKPALIKAAGNNKQAMVCYGLTPRAQTDFLLDIGQPYSIVENDPKDPVFYSTCHHRLESNGLGEGTKPKLDRDAWRVGDKCVSCEDSKANPKLDAPFWKLAKKCVDCSLGLGN